MLSGYNYSSIFLFYLGLSCIALHCQFSGVLSGAVWLPMLRFWAAGVADAATGGAKDARRAVAKATGCMADCVRYSGPFVASFSS